VNFNFNIEDINFSVDESMLRDEPEQGLQQPSAEPETAVQRQSEHEEFTVEWLLRGEQPPPPGHGGEFIQMPCRAVCWFPHRTVDDMLGLGPETMYGQRRHE
jgi:hypothetical protein